MSPYEQDYDDVKYEELKKHGDNKMKKKICPRCFHIMKLKKHGFTGSRDWVWTCHDCGRSIENV